MGNKIDLTLQTAWLDLVERAHAATPPAGQSGIVIERQRRGRTYLYHRAYDAATKRQRDRYLGADTPELRARLAREEADRTAREGRRQVVRALLAAGLPAPRPAIGKVLEALAAAGVFRLRTTLVGTHAFPLYGPMLGVTMSGTLQHTLDIDFAQSPDVSLLVEDAIDQPLLEILRGVDASFSPVDGLEAGQWPWRFVATSGVRVELLASHRGTRHEEGIVSLPALRAGAQALPFMDFLLRDSVPAVVLHGSGVPVLVPSAARFAIHKLIVSTRRPSFALVKATKDRAQAMVILEVLIREADADVTMIWQEAVGRGPAWREALDQAERALPDGPVREFAADMRATRGPADIGTVSPLRRARAR